ncbi:stalk domain-containing protein [Brevibacillus sp. B_LB10_24]|uniref:stalk domain-containing protein n=1 Tax=Brevibacillus sp. B_LB10_24 TaxID=3380645 RepID=UPI0038B98146
MKKKTIASSLVVTFAMCSLLTVLVPFTVFGKTENNHSYLCTIDAERTDFENGEYWLQKITYENGATTVINEADTFTFLMINSNFIPNVDIRIENGHSLVPIRLITEELGGQVNWDAKKSAEILYQNKKMTLTAGDKHAVIDGKTVVLPVAAKILENKLYVPLRPVADAFHMDVSYNSGIMPLDNPLISIDTREKNVTREEAVQIARAAMEKAYSTFLKNDTYVNGSDTANKVLAEIRQKIESIEYQDESAGYWILSGPYKILVDKSTGELFFKVGQSHVGGSYVESMYRVDENDRNIFVGGYFAG